MARRSDHTREELRAMAIKAGQAIVIAEGLSGLGARRVAREIGYTVGTLYNIFENFDDLVLHINGATLEAMHAAMQGLVEEDTVGLEALKKISGAYIEFAKEDFNRWNALFEFNLPLGQPLPKWYAQKIFRILAMAEAPLHGLVEDKLKAKKAAKIIWAGVHGICHLGITGKLQLVEAEPVEELVDSLLSTYIGGLQS